LAALSNDDRQLVMEMMTTLIGRLVR
jgi:hypothetical protein